MNLQWLEDYLTLWESQNFTVSASKSNISQAAFSRRILALENWLGHQLVDRSRSPVRFTDKGIQFHREAVTLKRQLMNARVSLDGLEKGDTAQIKILMPHVISSARFVFWWQEWSGQDNINVHTSVGNVTEIIAAFISGDADLLICHSGGSLPMMLNPDLYLSHTIEIDQFSPFAAHSFNRSAPSRFPGTQSDPIPLALYSKGGYFAGLVDDLMMKAPAQLYGIPKVEADTANLLKQFIVGGHGIGWLPHCALTPQDKEHLEQVGQEEWSAKLPIRAYVKADTSVRIVQRVWERLTRV